MIYQDVSFFILFCIHDNAKRKLVMSRPWWSASASHMIVSRKTLKRVGESRHPCRTLTVVLNQFPVLPFNRTALCALTYRFSMTRMMLALLLPNVV